MLNKSPLFTVLQWRLWLFQVLVWLLLLPAFTSWSLAVYALLLLAKLWQLYRTGPAWRLGYSNLLAGLLLAVLVLNVRQLGVMHLMFHLLLLAASLRLLGLTADRRQDAAQLIWVHYFLLACAFILHQDLWLAAVIFAAFALNLYAQYLIYCQQVPVLQWRRIGKSSVVLLAVTVAMFVLFPRLPPLWQLPGAKVTQTGLTDNLSPGDVSQLLESTALAFRVRFDSPAPPASNRYFRAKIYDVFDGATWRASRPQPKVAATSSDPATYRYTVIAEPHQQFSLFTLGVVQQHSQNTQLDLNNLLVTEQPLSQRISYQVSSLWSTLPARGNVNRYLQIPSGNQQSRKLALQFKQQAANATALVQLIGDYFRTQGFRYSLAPGPIRGEQIDTFIFSKKLGFCSHYAGATVFLLRAAGIPARLVGGYLGGDWQDNGAYLQVLQKDAHAWVEYYQNGYWLTFDPTALIEPALLQDTATDSIESEFSGAGAEWLMLQWNIWILQPLRNMDYYWSVWVLSFNNEQQQGLFEQLKHWRASLQLHTNWLGILAAIPLILFGVWYKRRPAQDQTKTLFWPLLRLKAKPEHLSYQQYLQMWQLDQPTLVSDISAVEQQYLRWQFGNEHLALPFVRRSIQKLARQIRRLRS